MEIRVLRYFLTAAREGSITGAANSLHLTQPTLSRQLKELETELGHKLFIRGKHNITLTPEGMILRKRAEQIVELAEKTQSEFHAIKDTVCGDVYIGCGETDSMKYVAAVMKDIQTLIAKDLLSIKAVFFRPNEPFTWASGPCLTKMSGVLL